MVQKNSYHTADQIVGEHSCSFFHHERGSAAAVSIPTPAPRRWTTAPRPPSSPSRGGSRPLHPHSHPDYAVCAAVGVRVVVAEDLGLSIPITVPTPPSAPRSASGSSWRRISASPSHSHPDSAVCAAVGVRGHLDEQFRQVEDLQDEASPNFVEEVAVLFFKDSGRLISNLEQALWDAYMQQLKGSCSSIGASRMKSECMSFKDNCGKGNVEGAC
nr:uncharacterized protein LOC127339060 [Lolium perenne]